jgi:hypothetical protein
VVDRSAQSDEGLLDRFQRAAFGYFLREYNPTNGLVADTSRPDAPASIAVVGFALSSYPVAVERGWMARADAAARTLVTLRFFGTARKASNPTLPAPRASITTSSTCEVANASGNQNSR